MAKQCRRNNLQYSIRLRYTIIAFCILPYETMARIEPMRDTAREQEETIDTAGNSRENLNNLIPYYATWDTNRMDSETAQLYARLSRAYATAGDKHNAYLFFERYSRVKDSLFYLAKDREIRKLKQDVATAGKDKELAEKNIQMMHNQELVSHKNAIVLGLAGGILLILILCLQSIKSYKDKHNLLKKVREQMDQDMTISILHASMQGEHNERDKIAIQLHNTIRPLLQEVQQQLEDIEQNRQDVLQCTAFSETQQIVQDVQQELGDVAAALASSGIETLGLVKAVTRFIRNIPKDNELTIRFTVTGKEQNLSAEKEMIIYRILQELVQNIMKHAYADAATIIMDYGKDELSIRVHDNGIGFDTKTLDQGLGWSNIRDRLLHLQGSCTRYNEAGTTVLIRLPMQG